MNEKIRQRAKGTPKIKTTLAYIFLFKKNLKVAKFIAIFF